MKTIFKILLVVFIINFSFYVIIPNNIVKAREAADSIIDRVIPSNLDETSSKSITGVASKILSFLQIISAIISVVMIAVTGFRYIMETPTVKEEMKKTMTPIITGIILVFFAVSIAQFFIGMFDNSINQDPSDHNKPFSNQETPADNEGTSGNTE